MKFELDLDFNLLNQQRKLVETLAGMLHLKNRQLLEGILTLIEDLNRQKAIADHAAKSKVVVSFSERDGANLQASVTHRA
jgi:hypothetical protein